MDQEKFSTLNQPSNAGMPRETVATLKQIQKQGLSISIVKGSTGSFPLPPTTSVDNRQKQSVLTVDKPKILPRPPTTTDNKITQARLTSADTRVSSGRVTTQSSFHDSKIPATQARQTQPAVSESKSFNQVWSGPNTSSESKTPSPMTTPANKMQTSQTRMNQIHIPDNKTPVSRSNQSMLSENKNQGRVIQQGQRVIQSQQLVDGKISNDRINPTSPPEAKVFSNQVRTGQQFVASQDNKPNPVQRVVPQKVPDVKIASQLNANKQVDKPPQANRVIQNVKVLPESNQGKIRQNYTGGKPDSKPSISGNSPTVVENKVRMVTNVESGATRTAQCKSAQMRLHPNVSSAEAPTAVLCTTVLTKQVICYQSVPAQPDKNVILQGAKITGSSDMIQKSTAVFDTSAESPHGNPMTSRIATSKRTTAIFGSPAKKKCVKRIIPSSVEMSGKSQDGSNMTSPEDGNENNEQFFNNLKTSRTGLTITPVRAATTSVPISAPNAVGVVRMPGELVDKDMYRLAWENSALIAAQRGKPRSRGRRKYVEPPVCLTLSSDDEEEHMQASFTSMEDAMNQVRMFPHESEGSKSGQSSPVYQDEENPESDDPQFPGVTDILPKSVEGGMHYEDDDEEDEEEKDMDEMEMEEEESMGEEEEEEMEDSDMEEEEEEEEEVPPEEDEEEQMASKAPLDSISSLKQPLQCRSIRVGSFKIHPKTLNSVLKVYLAVDGISFSAPLVSDASKIVNISLKPCDVTQLFVHFGKCLPILFVFTTPSFGENIRKLLNMTSPEYSYYDPTSNDEKVKKITFLIDSINEEQRRFLRYTFLSEKKVRELDQKTANEILVKSTPSQGQYVRCEVAQPFPTQVSQENVISVTAIQPTLQMLKVAPLPPPEPALKLFTYPPPPETGGITIHNEDVACLNEGEFLNDAIIDFYLKYVFYEKLSDYHREKTHIFSSYFYPRLTHKSERPRAGEDAPKSAQIRRHNMVKTWTRHVDIFSKDFIVIPVNQSVHWFLAIICYPGLVPEAPELPPKPDTKTNSKSSDNVTSTDDQEENKVVKEPNSTVDGNAPKSETVLVPGISGNNQNSDENSTASSSSMFEPEEPDSEEPMPEAPDSSTHPDKNRRRKEAPCICIFDSLNGPNRSRIATVLREYLEVEWKLKKGTRKVFDKNTMQGFIMQCPQQNNYSDCGIYVLQYVESFFENPLPYFDSPIPNLTNWFSKEKVAKKRQELKDLIVALNKKYGGTTTASTTNTTTIRKQNVSDSVPSSPAQTLQTDNR